MSEPAERAAVIDRFRTRSAAAGADVREVPRADVTAAIAEACEGPTVAAPLPWPDVDLPEDAETSPTPAHLEAATTGVTAASGAIADYGSLVLRSTADGAEPASLFPDRHVVVLRAEDVVPDVATALAEYGDVFREEAASAIVATGPSATADMGALVTGAHGPKEVQVILFGGDGESAEIGGESA